MKEEKLKALRDFRKKSASHNELFHETEEAFESEDQLSLLVLSRKFCTSSMDALDKIEKLSNQLERLATVHYQHTAIYDLIRVLLSESDEELALTLAILSDELKIGEEDYISV